MCLKHTAIYISLSFLFQFNFKRCTKQIVAKPQMWASRGRQCFCLLLPFYLLFMCSVVRRRTDITSCVLFNIFAGTEDCKTKFPIMKHIAQSEEYKLLLQSIFTAVLSKRPQVFLFVNAWPSSVILKWSHELFKK